MARGEGSVVVRIYGEIRDLASKLRTGGDEVGRFATRSRSLITKSFSDITSVVTSRMGRLGGEVQKSLDGIAAKAAISGSGVALGVGAGAAVAAAAIADLAAKGVRSFIDLTSQVRQFQRVSGATAEDASRLVAAVKLLGIEPDAVARGFFMLSRRVKDNAEALAADGVQIAHNRDGSIDLVGTLLNVSDAYKRVGAGAEGNRIAFDAFGRSGASLIPILSSGRDRLEDFFNAAEQHGEIFNQEDLDKGKEFQIQMRELEAAVGGLERALGEGLVPILTDVANTATEVIDDVDHLTRSVGGLSGIISKTWNGLTLKRVRDWAFGVKEGGQSLADLEASGEDVNAMLGEQAAGFDDVAGSADSASDSLKAFDGAIDGVNDSILGVPTAIADVDQAFEDLEKNASQSTSKAAEAQSKLADAIESANRRIRDAQQDVADATEDLNKISSGDRTDARRRVRDAEERLADTRADSAKSIADAKKNAEDLTPTVAQTRHEAEGVLTAVEKTVDEMIKQKRPASEILAYIIQQRDRFAEVGDKIGLDKTILQDYLTVLTLVYQTTKDLANLPALTGDLDSSTGQPIKGGAFGGIGDAAKAGLGALGGVNVTQIFNGPTDPVEQQRLAAKGFAGALRRRG